jgi:hypothetical protein
MKQRKWAVDEKLAIVIEGAEGEEACVGDVSRASVYCASRIRTPSKWWILSGSSPLTSEH